MAAVGGLDALTSQQRASAERSYEKWASHNPELARRHGFESYVSYVQERWETEPRGVAGGADEAAAVRRTSRPTPASAIVDSYLTLCKEPSRNLRAWHKLQDEREKDERIDDNEGAKARPVHPANGVEQIRTGALSELSLRVDALRQGWKASGDLLTRKAPRDTQSGILRSLGAGHGTGSAVSTSRRNAGRGTSGGGTGTGGRSGRTGRSSESVGLKFKGAGRAVASDAKINWSTIDGAGRTAAQAFEGMKAAVRADRSKTKDQIAGILRRLTQDQADAVKKARKEALELEKSRTRRPRSSKVRSPQKPAGNRPQGLPERPRL